MTNGIFIAQELVAQPEIKVIMPGGFLRRDSGSIVGSEGHAFVSKFNFQKGFFSTKGLTLNEGLTDVDSDEVAMKQKLLSQCKQVIAMVDSQKWGKLSFASFAILDQLHTVITDAEAPRDMLETLRTHDIEVIVV